MTTFLAIVGGIVGILIILGGISFVLLWLYAQGMKH